MIVPQIFLPGRPLLGWLHNWKRKRKSNTWIREKVKSLQEQENYTYQEDSPGSTRTDKEDTLGRSGGTCRISRTPPRLQNFWKTKEKRKKLRQQHYTKLWKPVKTLHDSRDSPQENSRRMYEASGNSFVPREWPHAHLPETATQQLDRWPALAVSWPPVLGKPGSEPQKCRFGPHHGSGRQESPAHVCCEPPHDDSGPQTGAGLSLRPKAGPWPERALDGNP